MRLLNQLSMVLVVACIVGTCAGDDSTTVHVNTDIADLIVVADMVPANTHAIPAQKGENAGENIMEAWIEKLWTMDKLKTSITEGKMRVVIAVAKKGNDVEVKLMNGTDVESLKSHSRNLGNFDRSRSTPNEPSTVTQNIKQLVENGGDRNFAPNLVVYICMFPKTTFGATFETWKDKINVSSLNANPSNPDVFVFVRDWMNDEMMLIARVETTGSTPYYAKVSEDDLVVPNGHDEVVTAISALLAQCNYTTTSDDESISCRYDEKQACSQEFNYIPADTSEHRARYCLQGNSSRPCSSNATCVSKCEKLWSECDCDTATQTHNVSGYETVQDLKHCPPPSTTVRTCTISKTCPKPSTEVDADAPVLAMPVWAVFVLTFSIVLILVVVMTLLIYYGCFPDPKNLDISSSRRHWGHRMGDTIRSAMRSVRVGSSRGRSERTRFDQTTQTRGPTQSMGPSVTRPYTDMSRQRR